MLVHASAISPGKAGQVEYVDHSSVLGNGRTNPNRPQTSPLCSSIISHATINSIVSRIHVTYRTELRNITCTLVATGVILRSSELCRMRVGKGRKIKPTAHPFIVKPQHTWEAGNGEVRSGHMNAADTLTNWNWNSEFGRITY
jgi:hypothetical protein